ncbi:MAG: putative quinol monooxygenase [Acidobacteriota bacterium]
MAGKTLHVVARMVARSGKEAALKETLTQLIEPTRAEPGCVRYELYQGEESPGEFLFVEEYKDEAAFDAHLASPHVRKALAGTASLLESEPDIRRYRRVS